MASSFTLFLSLLLPIALCFFIYLQKFNRTSGRLPPGPTPLPVIGNLHLLSPLPHRDVAKLSKTYGPILYLRLGYVPTIFISSPLVAEQVFKSHDIIFSNRPPSEASEIISYGHRSFGFAEYGPYWRKVRKLSISNLFTSAKLDSYEFVRKEEMVNFVESLKEAARARAMADVTSKVRVLVTDIVCRIVMGRKCMDESMDGAKISEHIDEVMRIFGSFNLNDALPCLRLFDLQGIRRRTRTVMRPIDKFLEKIIDEHVQLREKGKNKQKDYVDVLLDSMNDNDLDLELDRTSIKAIILETFTGTLDTSPDAIDWALVELLRHPTVMKKVREEMGKVVGTHRTVEESDLPKLTYLAMVIKESFRLHQLVPFIFRHTKEDVVLDGYNIPQGSNIMVCIWAMAQDPDLWHNPEEFIPERFENSSIDIKGHDFQLLPFGSGRRICPGMSFGLLMVPLVLAQLVHCFDWELPIGTSPSELDMKEKYGFTMPRVVHLNATPIYRLVDNHA